MKIFPFLGAAVMVSPRDKSIKNIEQLNSKIERTLIPVLIEWGKGKDIIRGNIVYSNNSGSGPIKFVNDDSSTTCSGSWKASSGTYDNGGKVQGVWAVSCSDGKTVTGEYQSGEEGTGSGVGYDDKGTKVTIRYGKLAI